MTATDPPPISSRRNLVLEALAIATLCLVINLAGNGRISLWDRDEPRYAECTREMRASGDYLHPTFNAEPRYQKPILIYWLMLIGTAVGGDNPFGARLISSIAGAATCVLVWWVGSRAFGRSIGRIAAMILMTAPIVVVNSKLATTDASLTLFLVCCQLALWKLSRGASNYAVIVFWSSLAFATLVKGPVAPAMIAMSGLVSWALGGPTSCWSRLRWRWGLALYVVLAAPWYLAIAWITKGAFFREAVGAQVLHRVTYGMEQHGGFPGYYLVTPLLTFYPWSALLPAAILSGWVKRKTDKNLGFLLGWAIGPLILLECVKTKLVHYYLPAYPACALLIAWTLDRIANAGVSLRRWPLGRLAVGLLAGTGVTLTVLSMGGVMVLPWSLKWPCLMLAIILGCGTLFAVEAFHRGRITRGVHGLVTTWGMILFLVGAWLLPAAEPYRFPQVVAREIAVLAAREQARPILASFKEPSIVYEIGKPVTILHQDSNLRAILANDHAAISALTPEELALLAKDPHFSVEVRETLRGFNLSKGSSDTLNLVVIRPAAIAQRPKIQR